MWWGDSTTLINCSGYANDCFVALTMLFVGLSVSPFVLCIDWSIGNIS